MRGCTLPALLMLALGGLVLFFAWQAGRPLSPAAADRLLQIAIANADKGRFDLAYADLQRILADQPGHHAARDFLATVCVNLRRGDEAGAAIAALPDEFLAEHFEESVALGKFLNVNGFLYQAEPLLRRLLAIRGDRRDVVKELLKCLRIAGENIAAAPYLVAAVRGETIDLPDLLMLTAPNRYWAGDDDIHFMKTVGQRNEDSITMLGYAQREIATGNLPSAALVLAQLATKRPDWQPVFTRLAIVHWLLGREDDWQRAMSGWDPETLDDADAWFVWGVWHREHRQRDVAVRCFGEALRRAPRHNGACAQLAVALLDLGFAAEAKQFEDYAGLLSQIELHCADAGQKLDEQTVRTIARECVEAGWQLEADAWRRFAKQRWPKLTWPSEPSAASESAAAARAAFQPLTVLDFQRYPLPARVDRSRQSMPEPRAATDVSPSWLLEDDAESLGLQVRFQNGLDPARSRAFMFEFAASGIAVLDYDRDGWPDVHFTQGARWPVQTGDDSLQDELWRNLGNGKFAPVTASAGTGEPGYSQGPAAGDLDGDGFPDLYLCNLGPNRCYRNNGDGTFTEITADTGTAGDDWSQSAALADLNGDGWPDLYVVNYLTGDVFERACTDAQRRPIQCAPTLFPAAQDRLYLNRGDGTFEDVTAASGIVLPDGKGLGILVGRLTGGVALDVYVANDSTPNFLFTRTAANSDSVLRFDEIGGIAGVAYGPQGTAESSMGIAAGDVNGDGQLDLFVTNFVREPSNLYLQETRGLFGDLASRMGLTAHGFSTEGWGTQFLDVDADGFLDLFVANGDLEEYASGSGRMPPHLFRNDRGQRMALRVDPLPGKYFERRYLGRAAVVWDWNGDGRDDLCVSHVNDPVAVLTNRTPNAGHRLTVRLTGVQAARDPIGTRVTVAAGGRSLMRELVAGDGFTATNERRLSFGLGDVSAPVDVTVHWIGRDAPQQFTGVAVDAEYLIIEGRAEPVLLRRFDEAALSEAR